MKKRYLGLGILLLLVMAGAAFAQQAQGVNPLFTQAQAKAGEVSASTLSGDVKLDFSRRWTSLANEQKTLWMIAGQVDAVVAAGNNPGFLDNYNQRVTIWQNNLQAFTADAASALAEIRTVREPR